ncbi:MAG: ATP-binding protein [Tannerella sp.]|jgi:DNA-binding Lrp family transcriptional regulator|nr:ATP-binding protein [Tannerella sp.]
MKNLPIGIQSFESLRSNSYLYIDKTEHIHRLVTTGKIYFLSRPRRFGKSMLISTLDALFSGRKELFEGLYIYDKWDWSKSNPVIRIDWTAIKHDTLEEIEISLSSRLKRLARGYEITLFSEYASDCFAEMIEELHRKTGKKAVVLVDEYDAPILDAMSKSPAELKAIQESLQSFYKILKATDEHLQFVFLTGVSKFAKLSIFSSLNSPKDITVGKKYAALCGYTQEELETDFSEHIAALAAELSLSREETLAVIKKWYNGYSWDGETCVYNPYSALSLFDVRVISNYWFASGTPTFLIEQLKKREQTDLALEPFEASPKIFDSFDPLHIENIPLLFQTGYLTVKSIRPTEEEPQYTLGIPNREVFLSLSEYLLSAYSEYPLSGIAILKGKMSKQLKSLDSVGFAQSVRTMLENIPYNIQIGNEKYYHSLFLSWMLTMGFEAHGEVMTGSGRIDAVLEQSDTVIVSELKYHAKTKTGALLRNAMKQIHDRRYYEKYLDKGKKIVLLALAFSGKEVGCKMETLSLAS